MSLDFQQVQEQVRQLGENASSRKRGLEERREAAQRLLQERSEELAQLRDKVERVARQYDHSLRCASPALGLQPPQFLNRSFPLPGLPPLATVVAADGSQIGLDRHAPVAYCLINVGAVRLCLGADDVPQTRVSSRLLYEEMLFNANGSMISEAQLALRRDHDERTALAALVEPAVGPVVALTDGPVELWGAKGSGEEAAEFLQQLNDYKAALRELKMQGASAAGYVDKPTANLVVRLLEVAMTEENELPQIRQFHPLQGVRDQDLYEPLLAPGERSAVFVMQSQSASLYEGDLAVHFFYLNVGREAKPWLARVEVPAWVAQDPARLDTLHAVLVDQCRAMGARPYPYLIHRAHETAVVSMEEHQQVTQMIAMELRRRGLDVGDQSQKQGNKELAGRTSYR